MSVDHHPTFKVPDDNQIARATIFIARCKYDFAVDGGAVGAITLMPDATIPSGSLILGCYINCTADVVGGAGTTGALHINSADDLVAAAVVTGAPFEAGRFAGDHTLGSAPIELTADRNITFTIAVNPVTAGVFEVLVLYLPPGL